MVMTPDNEVLVRDAQSGGLAEFRRLYDAYARKVYNFCFRLAGSGDMAEDAAQETFISVYKNLAGLKDASRFEPWLFQIARNYVYQSFRKQQSDRRFVAPVEAEQWGEFESAGASESATPEERLQDRELGAAILEALAALDWKYREVFALAVLQGLSYSDTARIVGRKMESVKTDIHRARLQMREKLAPLLGRERSSRAM